MEPCWLLHVWKFLNEINGTIAIENAWTPESIYTHDSMIMEREMEMKLLTKTIQFFNLCRLYKQMYFFHKSARL